MDISTIHAVLQPYVQLFGSLMLSSAGVTTAVQIMKSNLIPIPAQTNPRITAAIASLLAALISLYVTGISLVINTFWGWLALAVGIYLLSAMIYNHIVKQS